MKRGHRGWNSALQWRVREYGKEGPQGEKEIFGFLAKKFMRIKQGIKQRTSKWQLQEKKIFEQSRGTSKNGQIHQK